MKCQIVIAGVGGQGVLFGARIFTEIARHRGLRVLGSETHGMSQRGGSVTSHLKIGEFQSPLVGEGDADLLLGLDCLEAHRTLPFLRPAEGGPGALCVVSAPDAQAFPDARVAPALADMGVEVHTCAADAAAMELGSALVANLVLLGFGARLPTFPFSYEEIREAVETLSSPAHRSANLSALERGSELKDLAAT
jgi:indolepyruvate ferredoxin oxidoreductase beta subunit